MSDASTTAPADPDANDLALQHQLCFALYAATHAFTRRYKPLLDPLGLTYAQYLCMIVLWEEDDQTVKQIGDKLELDSGTLTPLLKRLEARALLRRTRDPRDERKVRIGLTPAGRLLRNRAGSIPTAILCATGGTAEEMNRLAAELHRLRDRLSSQD